MGTRLWVPQKQTQPPRDATVDVDAETLSLKVKRVRMHKRILNVRDRIALCKNEFQTHRQNRDKARGAITLRKQKTLEVYELQLMKMEQTLSSAIVDIETAEAQHDAFQGLTAANTILGEYAKVSSLEAVEQLVDDTQDLLADHNRVSEFFGTFMDPDAAQGATTAVCDVEDELMALWVDADPEQQADDDQRIAVPA